MHLLTYTVEKPALCKGCMVWQMGIVSFCKLLCPGFSHFHLGDINSILRASLLIAVCGAEIQTYTAD
jgi:hypothetical protein